GVWSEISRRASPRQPARDLSSGPRNPPGDAAGGKGHQRLWFRERDEAPADSRRQHEVAS
ncbi:hypothetical protein ACE04B_14305, partial [Rhizobium phaseoli]